VDFPIKRGYPILVSACNVSFNISPYLLSMGTEWGRGRLVVTVTVTANCCLTTPRIPAQMAAVLREPKCLIFVAGGGYILQ